METPAFLAWAIEFTCPIRGEQDGSDPERTERQLRAARAVSDARRENRVLDGIAALPPLGFRIADSLAIYGGESAVAAACRNCPANCRREDSELNYAGCFGLTPVTPDTIAAVEHAIEQLDLASEIAALFPATTPRWYALWFNSPLSSQQLAVVARLAPAAGLADLAAGCDTGLAANLRLHVQFFPAGKIERSWWRLMAHCPRCKAAWLGERSRQCRVCNYVGQPAPDKKRRPRGKRPYTRLDNILGGGQSTEFLARYFDRQTHARSPDRE